MILEGIVTTLAADGSVHIAPMGPRVDGLPDRLLLRPYRTSRTYQNLRAHGEGVLHVTDDVLLLAQAAAATVQPSPDLFPASRIRGFVLRNACRYYEFRVHTIDDRADRIAIEAGVLHIGRLRDFFGFNRAKHAVVEAAILATRTDFLPLAEIMAEYRKLAVLVDKTGGEQERQAFAFLQETIARTARSRGAPA